MLCGCCSRCRAVQLLMLRPAHNCRANLPLRWSGQHVGDAPDDPGPLATDLSAELKPKAIDAAMKKVARLAGDGCRAELQQAVDLRCAL